jgi:hypothetical protein
LTRAARTTRPKRLTPAGARKILAAQTRYWNAKRELEEATVELAKVHDRYRHLFPLKRWITSGKIAIRRRQQATGRGFSLSGYLDAGHRITAAMRPHVSEGSSYEIWDVQVTGPRW